MSPEIEPDIGDEPGKIKAVIFDQSGTIFDDRLTVYTSHIIVLNICKQMGITWEGHKGELPTFDDWLSYSTRVNSALTMYFAMGMDENALLAESLYSTIYEEVRKSDGFEPVVYDGVEDTLSSLKDMKIKTGVVSAHPHISVVNENMHYGLDRYHSFIIGNVENKGRELERLSKELDIPVSSMVYVGDTIGDMNGAMGAGVSFVFKRGGYTTDEIIDHESGELERLAHPHVVIGKIPELLENMETLELMMRAYITRGDSGGLADFMKIETD